MPCLPTPCSQRVRAVASAAELKAVADLGLLAALPRNVLTALVRFYCYWLSPWLGSNCRFEPTCSAYALDALERHGAAAGSYLMLARLVRCAPWCPGGHDPVPAEPPRLFTQWTHAGAAHGGPIPHPSRDNHTT